MAAETNIREHDIRYGIDLERSSSREPSNAERGSTGEEHEEEVAIPTRGEYDHAEDEDPRLSIGKDTQRHDHDEDEDDVPRRLPAERPRAMATVERDKLAQVPVLGEHPPKTMRLIQEARLLVSIFSRVLRGNPDFSQGCSPSELSVKADFCKHDGSFLSTVHRLSVWGAEVSGKSLFDDVRLLICFFRSRLGSGPYVPHTTSFIGSK